MNKNEEENIGDLSDRSSESEKSKGSSQGSRQSISALTQNSDEEEPSLANQKMFIPNKGQLPETLNSKVSPFQKFQGSILSSGPEVFNPITDRPSNQNSVIVQVNHKRIVRQSQEFAKGAYERMHHFLPSGMQQ
jgi:hypothetical protein